MSRLGFAFVLVALAAIPALGAYGEFMKIGNLKGTVTDPAHKDWIEISDFSMGVTQHGAGAASTTRGTASPTETVTIRVRQASLVPQLNLMSVSGEHFPTVLVDIGNLRHTFQTVYVSGVTTSSIHGSPEAIVTLSFRSHTVAVTPKPNPTPPAAKVVPSTSTVVVPPRP